MPIILTRLRLNDRGQAVVQVHDQLQKLGALIEGNERTAKRFGATTLAAVVAFRKQFGLPDVTGNAAPFDASVGRLLPVATAATEGNLVALKAIVREAVAASANALPQENSALARFAVIAGDYPTAQEAARRAPQLSDLVGQIINASVDPRSLPKPPEVPFPESFYTYHNDLLPLAVIEGLQEQLRSITPDQAGGPVDRGPDSRRGDVLIEVTRNWLEAIRQWQIGNSRLELRRYANATASYDACQAAALNYFTRYLNIDAGTGSLDQRLSALIINLGRRKDEFPQLWEKLQRRRILLSLEELHEHDWTLSPLFPKTALELIKNFLRRSEIPLLSLVANRQLVLDAPLIIIAYVLVPLARAEANRLRRQYERAVVDLNRVIRPLRLGFTQFDPRPLLLVCDFIELPFARLLLAETLLDKADVEYKARTTVAAEGVAALEATRAEFKQRMPDPGNRNQKVPFQLLQAAKSYLDVVNLFATTGEYVPPVKQGLQTLTTELSQRLSQGDVTSNRFRAIGKDITIPTIRPLNGTLPGVQRTIAPHEPLLQYEPPNGQTVMREINPRVYAILLAAQARLVQLWSGFNYLGYTDDYVPPQRFQFLLDRARYFAEHAKNAQRDYLNFLNNAEQEDLQEQSAAQNVEMEKVNVRIEAARVDQVRAEVAAAQQSNVLAQLSAANSQLRFERYLKFDNNMERLEEGSLFGAIASGISGLVTIGAAAATGGPAAAIGPTVSFLKSFSANPANSKADEQRELEKFNLGLAIEEAGQAAEVAVAQLVVAQGGLIVAALQRQSSLLRHEFAIQNLNFIRLRVLNAEQWYRLAGTIRSVSETYLRYAIELSFLAEQAYEFEADKTINVIRFDYDQSEIGDFLAADFLLRDLDTLEQDLIISQRLGRQEVRYVLSMAREFPEALQGLRDNRVTTFSLPLEHLERRFPGLHNLRIGAVDVLPLALMDPTRFSLELTYLGSSRLRLKGEPGGTDPWPKQFRTREPETVIFSGLSQQEANAVFPFSRTSQRNAFEGLGASSAWQVDLSMPENRIVPGSLADMLITFTLSGYYDSDLRTQQSGELKPRTRAVTRVLAAHQDFADAFYEFNQSGRMEWQVTDDVLTLGGSVGALRNVAVLCTPSQKRPELGRLMCSYPVEFEVDTAGNIQLLRELPLLSLSTNGLELSAILNTLTGSTVSFDFGDGTGLADSASLPHTYTRPGRYDVLVRIADGGRLTEYRAAVVVSRQHAVQPPCIAVPALQTTVVGGKIKLEPTLVVPSGEQLSVVWRIDNVRPEADRDPLTFTLNPGRYVLRFSATRPLTARFYSQQRFNPARTIQLQGLHLATNRTFDLEGNETTTNLNTFGQHVFASNTLAPADRWTLELPQDDNASIVSVSSTDVKQHDLSELSDAVLALEYEIRDR